MLGEVVDKADDNTFSGLIRNKTTRVQLKKTHSKQGADQESHMLPSDGNNSTALPKKPALKSPQILSAQAVAKEQTLAASKAEPADDQPPRLRKNMLDLLPAASNAVKKNKNLSIASDWSQPDDDEESIAVFNKTRLESVAEDNVPQEVAHNAEKNSRETKSSLRAKQPPPPPVSTSAPASTLAQVDPMAKKTSEEKKAKKLARRKLIINELIQTERTYVRNLKVICEVFLEPLEKLVGTRKAILTKGEIATVFGQIRSILRIQQQLLHDSLEKLVVEKDDGADRNSEDSRKRGLTATSKSVAGTFQMFAPVFQLYSKFVVQFDASIALLTAARKKRKKLVQFLRECSENSRCNGMALESYLIMPVQRVPRYKMLLTELLKHTNPTKNDYADLDAAVKAVSDVAKKINNSIHSRDATETMAQIQKDFSNACNILKSSRLFLDRIDGIVSQRGGANAGKMEDATFYLFNDMLLIGKPSSSIFGSSSTMVPVVDPIDLTELSVSFVPGSASMEIGDCILSWKDKSMAPQILQWQNKLADAATHSQKAKHDLTKRSSVRSGLEAKGG